MSMPAAQHKVACFGEILWDLLPGGAVPGGAPMNVAYHLHQLGESPALITRIGLDERGTALQQIIQSRQIDLQYLQTDPAVATGIVHALADANGDMKYEIVSPAAWDFITSTPQTLSMVSQTQYFVFGSLATRHQQSRETLFELLDAANTKVLDINLRAPFYDRDSIAALLHKADILKVNNHELELISAWSSQYGTLTDQISWLKDTFHIDAVIVTRGGEGAAVHYNGILYEHPGFRVKVADTVGSGDAFLAGFLYRILQNDLPENALEFACALGALVASKTGAWPEYRVEEIDQLINL